MYLRKHSSVLTIAIQQEKKKEGGVGGAWFGSDCYAVYEFSMHADVLHSKSGVSRVLVPAVCYSFLPLVLIMQCANTYTRYSFGDLAREGFSELSKDFDEPSRSKRLFLPLCSST